MELAAPDRDLFEFCAKSYWDSLGTEQLIKWNQAVICYLAEREEKYAQKLGLALVMGECDVDLTGSGRNHDDFDGKHFDPISLYKFLSWTASRLVEVAACE